MNVRSLWLVIACLGLVSLLAPRQALAIPAFARQTGLECASCHVGSFGPQLTRTGRLFKAGGYTMGHADHFYEHIAAMIQGGSEHTAKPVDSPEVGKPNDNVTVDQVSLFFGGGLSDHVGLFSQVTYDPNAKATTLDNTDLRIANSSTLGGKSLIYGLSLNNNPSMQDLWNTTPAWGFPYITSALAPAPDVDSFLGGQGGAVMGVGGYALYNDIIYVEYSSYRNISDKWQKTIGNGDVAGNDHLKGSAAYWRAAVQHDFGPHYIEIGTFGYSANRYPSNVRDSGSDRFTDSAVDATWQFTTADGNYNISAYATALHETQDLHATFLLSGSDNPRNRFESVKSDVSLYYKNTYGLTLGSFATTGTADATYYGSANGRPDSRGTVLQVDYTPFGRQGAPAYPDLNIRLFAQYTAYDKFNGAKRNYDGTGRNAAGNNTLFIGLWSAF